MVRAASNETAWLAQKEVWVPPGSWIEEDWGAARTGAPDGSTVLHGLYPLSEIPVLVRAGAVVPTRRLVDGDTIATAARPFDELVMTVYPFRDPAATKDMAIVRGNTTIYEDDGNTTDYLNKGDNDSMTHTFAYVGDLKSADTLHFTMEAQGSYPGMAPTQQIELRLVHMPPVKSVHINKGTTAAMEGYVRYGGGPGTWSYDGARATAVVSLPAHNVTAGLSVDVQFMTIPDPASLSAVRGWVRRANLAKQALDDIRQTPGAHQGGGGQIDLLAAAGDVLARAAGGDLAAWTAAVGAFPAAIKAAVAEAKGLSLTGTDAAARTDFVRGLLALP